MGSVTIGIEGAATSYTVGGNSLAELAGSFAEFKATEATAGTYTMTASLQLVHLAFAEATNIVETAIGNMPVDSLQAVHLEVGDEAITG